MKRTLASHLLFQPYTIRSVSFTIFLVNQGYCQRYNRELAGPGSSFWRGNMFLGWILVALCATFALAADEVSVWGLLLGLGGT